MRRTTLMVTRPGSAHRRWCSMAIVAATMLFVGAYANSLRAPFHFDDAHVIETNPAIRSLTNVPRIFADARAFSSLPANQTYRPMVSVTLAFDYAIARLATGNGLDPLAYHLTQVLVLGLVAILLATMANELFRLAARDDPALAPWAPPAAIVAGALFALHAGNSEVGNYVSARSESLSAAGILCGLLLYLRGGVWRGRFLYLLPVALGIMSKTPAALFAPLLCLWLVIGDDQDIAHALRRTAPSLIIVTILALFVEAMNPPEQRYGLGNPLQNLWTQAWVSVRYAGMFFFPVGLSADSDWGFLPAPWDLRVFAGLCVMAISLAVCWRTAASPRTRPIAFGVIWFWIGLTPSALVPLAEATNDHRPFLAFVGLSIAFVWWGVLVVRQLRDGRVAERTAVAAALALLLAHSLATHRRNGVWSTEASLWADVVRKSPGNPRGLMNFALVEMQQGRIAAARVYLDSAARLAPSYALLFVNIAIAADAEADSAAALVAFDRALSLDPSDTDAHRYYGAWLIRHGRARQARVQYGLAIAGRPADLGARHDLLLLLLALGEKREAADEARHILAFDRADSLARATAQGLPSVAPASDRATAERLTDRWNRAGWLLTLAGRNLEAIQAYRAAVDADPANTEALTNLGWSFGILGLFDLARPPLERAVSIAPGNEVARNDLAWVDASLRRRP